MLSSLMSTCKEGPAVSLSGSPTVSHTTPALCAMERHYESVEPANWKFSYQNGDISRYAATGCKVWFTPLILIAAWAAARRAIGTRYGEHNFLA